jgi:hypothetical protein
MSRLAEMPHCWTLIYSHRLAQAGWQHREHEQKVQAMAPPFLQGSSIAAMCERLRGRMPRITLADIPAGPEDCA